jgi:hypothetical protein
MVRRQPTTPLSPCPFCAKPAARLERETSPRPRYSPLGLFAEPPDESFTPHCRVVCESCGASSAGFPLSSDPDQAAAKAWNRRAT